MTVKLAVQRQRAGFPPAFCVIVGAHWQATEKTSQSVIDIYDGLYQKLGPSDFIRLFPVIFTDNGSAFHFYYGEELTQKLGCQKAAARDINLMPELLKKWGTHNKSENRGTKFECYFQNAKVVYKTRRSAGYI